MSLKSNPTASSQSKPSVTATKSIGGSASSFAGMTSKNEKTDVSPVLSKGEKTSSEKTTSAPIIVRSPLEKIAKGAEQCNISFAAKGTSPPKKVSTGSDYGRPEKPEKTETTKSSGLSVSSKIEKADRITSAYMDRAMPTPPEATAPVNILVTGASRGIGFSLVQEFLSNRKVKRVIATVRKGEDATDIKKKITDSRLIVVIMDVSDDDSIEKAYDSVAGILEKEGLTLLVNNAGTLIPYNVREKPKRADLIRQLDVNSISPIVITQVFLPLLLKAAENSNASELSVNRAAVVNISDVAGSIALNNADQIISNPPRMAYRMSKTALNSATRSLSLDLSKDGILVVAICPGSVQTRMGTQAAELTLEESMNQLAPTIYGLRAKHNGCFIQRDGKPIVF